MKPAGEPRQLLAQFMHAEHLVREKEDAYQASIRSNNPDAHQTKAYDEVLKAMEEIESVVERLLLFRHDGLADETVFPEWAYAQSGV